MRPNLPFLTALLSAAWLAGCGTQSPEPPVSRPPPQTAAIFVDVTADCGVRAVHQATEADAYFFPAVMSPGAAVLDYDTDGDLDILFADGSPAALSTSSAPEPRSSLRLFRQDRPWQFVEVPGAAGLVHQEFGMGLAIGDVNNDGRPDVYCSNFGPDKLFLNEGNGSFRDVSSESGIDLPEWGASALFGDFDRDGWLDLFVSQYVAYDRGQPCRTNDGRQDFCNPAQFPGVAARVLRNLGTDSTRGNNTAVPRFEDVTIPSGVGSRPSAGLGVALADFNRDSWVDVYVANDGQPNCLWINQQNGTFREEAVIMGTSGDTLGRAQGSMGIALGDVNGDSRFDLLVTNLDGENNALYLGTDAGDFQDRSQAAGLGAASLPRTGFGTAFLDVDHDGDLDLAVVNGRVTRAAGTTISGSTSSDFWSPYAEHNQLFLNDGHGKFTTVSSPGDGLLRQPVVGRALIMADLDHDGDLDLVTTESGGPVRCFRNDAAKQGHWLQVRAILPQCGGRDAYGAVVRVQAADRTWVRVCSPASSYLSSHDPRVHFGLGPITQVSAIEVDWPDGRKEVFPGSGVDAVRILAQGEGQPR